MWPQLDSHGRKEEMKNHFIRTFYRLETKSSHQSSWEQWPCWTLAWFVLSQTLPTTKPGGKGPLICVLCLQTLRAELSLLLLKKKITFLLTARKNESLRSGAGKQLTRKEEQVIGSLTCKSPREEASRS